MIPLWQGVFETLSEEEEKKYRNSCSQRPLNMKLVQADLCNIQSQVHSQISRVGASLIQSSNLLISRYGIICVQSFGLIAGRHQRNLAKFLPS